MASPQKENQNNARLLPLHKAHKKICEAIEALKGANPHIPELLQLIDHINVVKLRMTKALE